MGGWKLRGDMVFRKYSKTTEPKRSTRDYGVYELRGVDWEPPMPYVYEKFPRKYLFFLFGAPGEPNRLFCTSLRSATALGGGGDGLSRPNRGRQSIRGAILRLDRVRYTYLHINLGTFYSTFYFALYPTFYSSLYFLHIR